MKGNNGRGSREKLQRQVTVASIAIISLLSCMLLIDCIFGSSMISSQSLRSISLEDYMKRKQSFDSNIQKILDAEYTLVGIKKHEEDFNNLDTQSYDGIIGKFCKVNFAVHKESPSTVPMFKDILKFSPECDEPYEIDLKFITQEAQKYDAVIRNHNEQKQTQEEQLQLVPKVLNFTGAVFHESRCGSTLVANTLIGMDPKRHRVYSESPPPIYALGRICDSVNDCAPGLAARILKDVIYMMSRSNDQSEERVFFKIQSKGSWYIQDFRSAFPEVPWIFVYREPVEVMMSQFRGANKNKANCVSYQDHPNSHIEQVATRYEKHHRTTEGKFTLDEFCAIHLASLTENAVENLKDSHGVGHAIDYVDLPDTMYETVLPEFWGVSVNEEQKNGIIEVSKKYSKARDVEEKQTWNEDSKKKKEAATPEIREAAMKIMGESFYELELYKPRMH